MRGRTGTRNSARLLPRPVWAREQDAARGSGREVALLHYSGYRVASQATATKAAVAHAAAVAVDRRQHAAAGLEQAVRHLNLERPRNTPSSDFQHWICPPKLQSSNGMQFSARLGWQKCMRSAPRRPVRDCVVHVQCFRSAGGSERVRCVSHSLCSYYVSVVVRRRPVSCAHGVVRGCAPRALRRVGFRLGFKASLTLFNVYLSAGTYGLGTRVVLGPPAAQRLPFGACAVVW
jgi:hypothetical protein